MLNFFIMFVSPLIIIVFIGSGFIDNKKDCGNVRKGFAFSTFP